MQPILSIIVPVFNAEKYLKSCLLSLLNQTMHEIEVICIDDGSTDESLAILNNLQKKDSRLIVYSQKNQGPAVARNKGLELSTGKYILFCDADDEYKNTYCEIMYKTISSNDELDFVICRTVQINRDLSIGYNYFVNRYFITNKWKKYINTTFNLDQDKKSDIDICLWNKIFRKKNILKYGINFPVNHKCDDNLFVYKYLAISKKAKILDKELYVHYDRQNSIMDLYFSNIDYESIYDHIYILSNIFYFINNENLWKENRFFYKNVFVREIYTAWKYTPNNLRSKFLNDLQQEINSIDFYNTELSRTTTNLDFLFKQLFVAIEQKHFYEISRWLDSYIEDKKETIFDSYGKVFYDPESCSIVFNCNDSFVKYLSVTIISILQNNKERKKINFYILHTDISTNNKEILDSIIFKYNECKIFYINVIDVVRKYNLHSLLTQGHVSVQAYYRLLVPLIFLEFDKVIYLDCDLIVKKDIFELWNICFDEEIAAVRDFYVSQVSDSYEVYWKGFYSYSKDVLKIELLENYFNSGVIVYNLKKIDLKKYSGSIFDIAKNNIKYFNDQNVLNSYFNKKVFLLPYSWNVQINSGRGLNKLCIPSIKGCNIIHFTSKQKPWGDINTLFAFDWWQNAKLSPFYIKFIKNITYNNSSKQASDLPSQLCLKLLKQFYLKKKFKYQILNFLLLNKVKKIKNSLEKYKKIISSLK